MPKYTKKITVIDLFSGLGGFSQAFLTRGHDVIRIDNDEQFKDVQNTIIKDILELEASYLKDADIILAGIDCTHLTHANNNPDKEGLRLSKKLVRHTISLIHSVKPKYWVIENPLNSRIWKIIGPPTYKTAWGYWGEDYLKPTGIKGVLPNINWPTKYVEPLPKPTWNYESFKTHKFSYLCPRDPKRRSLIPYSFSLALCIGCEKNGGQETLA